MRDQPAGGSNKNIRSFQESLFLLFKFYSISSSIDSHGTDVHIVGETFKLLVNLNSQFPCRGKDQYGRILAFLFSAK